MDFNVKDFGAVGDGKTLNTSFIQKTIDECAKNGGGRVILENGTFLCGSIELHSYVELYVSLNAILLGSPNCKDFPERKKLKHVESKMLPRERNASFIFAEECENIALTGQGIIDCNGDNFVKYRGDDSKGWVYERINEPTPPRVVFFTGCKNVKIEDITMQNQPAGWSYWIHDCDYVSIDKIKIMANVDYPNNDGIHINCSRNVTVSNCNITCGDDCIVVRANSVSLKENKVCEKISVCNCNLTSYSGGIRIAWVNDGTIRNCVFSNLVMIDTTVGISLFIPPYNKRPESTDVGREQTKVENLTFNNIIMNEVCSEPVRIYLCTKEHANIDYIKNLYFSGIHAKGPHFFTLLGREDCQIENICFNDCDFELTDGKEIANRFRHGATSFDTDDFYPMTIRYVKGLRVNNCQWNCKQ